MVHPGRMQSEQLTRTGGNPFWQSFIIFARGGDLPAHDEEHDVEDGDLFGEGGEIGEFGEDVREDFAEGVGVDAGGGVEEGRDGGVGGADEVGGGGAFGGAGAAVGEEVEEDYVQWAGGRGVADGDAVGD